MIFVMFVCVDYFGWFVFVLFVGIKVWIDVVVVVFEGVLFIVEWSVFERWVLVFDGG